jgi:hypothetical protein
VDDEDILRVLKALDGALAVLRDAEGRRSVHDLRVQSMIAAARATLAERIEARTEPPSGPSASPFLVDGMKPLPYRPPLRTPGDPS